MTTDNQTDQQAIAALAAAQEAEQITAELQAAMDTINGNLDAIHQSDDAATRLALAENTSAWCGYLTSLTANAVALSGSAIEIARRANEAADAAMDELSALINAVEDIDRDNPYVDTLVEAVEENVSEWAYDSAAETVYEDLSDSIITEIASTLEVNYETADRFSDAIRGQYHPWRTGAPSHLEVLDLLIARLEARRDHVAAQPARPAVVGHDLARLIVIDDSDDLDDESISEDFDDAS